MAIANTENKPALKTQAMALRESTGTLINELVHQQKVKEVLEDAGIPLTSQQITALDNALSTVAVKSAYDSLVDIFTNVNPV